MKLIYKGKLITKDLKYCTSLKDQLLGLLLKENPRHLLFKTRWGIHTFLLKNPIDIVILDKKYKIVTLKQSLPPNQIYLWNPKHYLIIEVPQGTIKKFSLKLENKLEISKFSKKI